MGDSPREAHRQAGPFTLPSIATMTQGIAKEESPKQKAHTEMMRDSGMWSMQSPSKHSSTISSATGFSTTSSNPGLHLHTILNSSDDSHRFSGASGGTPSTRYSREPPTSQPPTNSHDNRVSIDANNTSFLDSRRSSIDSKVGINVGHLSVNSIGNKQFSSSPLYERENASELSLASSTVPHSFRNMAPPIPPPKTSNSVLSPHTRRPVTAGGQPPRRAPPISANPRAGGMPNPMAAAPTKGYAWAFPDEPGKDDPDESMTPESSRQASLNASSINTIESSPWAMKHGDEPHSMQHKAISNLQAGDLSQTGIGNYSRTPELRVSHKLAERKRRSEMKDLFDSLNRILPHPPGNKASKWEVLSKAVDYITGLKSAYDQQQRDIEKLRSDLDHARSAAEENHVLSNEITAMYQQLCRVDPNGHHVFGPRSQFLDQQSSQTPGRLAPMQSSGGFSAMQGVEYNNYDRR